MPMRYFDTVLTLPGLVQLRRALRETASELTPLEPGAHAPMRKAPGRLDQRELFHVAVDVPDPTRRAQPSARHPPPPDPVARQILVQSMGDVSIFENAEPETEIVIRLVLHG